jgi:AcrR family transcriptional regulator
MPFPRFDKLAQAKRERILDVAAQEFAAYGFEEASINRILERAQMSKGAAYYYFADKVDLFSTTVYYCIEHLQLIKTDVESTTLTAITFWPTFAELHRQPLLRSFERPWLFGTLRAAGRLSPSTLERTELATLANQIKAWAMTFVKQGQQVGVIRTDLSDELLFAWLDALDSASDQWLLTHWQELDRTAIERISDLTVEAMQRAVVPSTSE